MVADPRRSIRILVEDIDDDSIKHHLFFFFLQRVVRNNLQVKQIPDSLKTAVAINFATLDDFGYRLEEDKSEAVAVANFGDKNFVAVLKSFFDDLWRVSKPVLIPLTA